MGKEKRYFTGSGFWFAFWVLAFWPIAIWYWYDELKTIKEIEKLK